MYLILYFLINVVTCQILKLNISVPLSFSEQYVDSHVELFNQMKIIFQDVFSLDYSQDYAGDKHMILLSQMNYITPYLVFNVQYRIKPQCRYNNMYLVHIYNCVSKTILLCGSKFKMKRFLIAADREYADVMNNLVMYIERLSFRSVFISELSNLHSYISMMNEIEVYETVILNFYTDYEQFNDFYSVFNSSPLSSYIMHISFFMDEYYTTHNSNRNSYNNTYIVSQYFQSNDDKMIYKMFNLSENEYVDSRIYGFFDILSFLISSSNETYGLKNNSFYPLFQALSTNYIINYKENRLFDHYFIKTSYFGKVNESGNINDIVDLNSDVAEYPSDLWLYENQNVCINGVKRKEDVFLIGFMSVTTEYNPNYLNILRGIVESIDYVNSNTGLLNKRIKLILPDYSVDNLKAKYDYLMSFKVNIIIYYYSTMMYDNLFDFLNDESPYIFALGYNSGEVCHPNIIPIGTNIPTQMYYFETLHFNEITYVLYSNTVYGRNGFNYIQREKKAINEECVGIMVSDSTSVEMKKSINEFISIINANNERNIYLIGILGDNYTSLFMKEYYPYKIQFPNVVVYLMDMNENDFINNELWSGYNSIRVYMSDDSLPQNLSTRFLKYHPSYNISYFEYLGSVSERIFEKLVITCMSTSKDDFNGTITDSGITIDDPNISILNNNYITLSLGDFVSTNDNQFLIKHYLHPYVLHYPSYIRDSSTATLLKCDWKSSNYTSQNKNKIDTILCLYNDVDKENSYCSTLFYIFTFYGSSALYIKNDYFVIPLKLPISTDPSYNDTLLSVLDFYNPIVVYGYRDYKEKGIILDIMAKNIPLLSLHQSDDYMIYDNLFNFGIETSDYIESVVPFLLFDEDFHCYIYISDYFSFNQTKIYGLWNYFREIYRNLDFEYSLYNYTDVTIDKILYNCDNNQKMAIFVNLDNPEAESIARMLSVFRDDQAIIFHLRNILNFYDSPVFRNQIQLMSEYIPEKGDKIYWNIERIKESIKVPENVFYFHFLDVYYSYEFVINSMLINISAGKSIIESLISSSLHLSSEWNLKFSKQNNLIKTISAIKNDGENKIIQPIGQYIQLSSNFVYGNTFTTGGEMTALVGLIIDLKRMEAESKSLIIAFQTVMIHYSNIWFVVYDLENNSVVDVWNYFNLRNVKVMFGFLSKNHQEAIDPYLKQSNMIFYNYGYPFSTEKYLSNIFQLNSISDYISFISFIYLTDHDNGCLLVLDRNSKFDDFNPYLIQLLNDFNIKIPHIYVNNTMTAYDILDLIMTENPLKRNIIISLDVTYQNSIIEMLAEYLLQRQMKLSVLHFNYFTYLENITHFSYTDNIDYNDLQFPFITVNKPDNALPPLYTMLKMYLEYYQTMSDSQIFDILMNDRVNFNEYHQSEKQIYVLNGRNNIVIRIPNNSTIFFKRAEYYYQSGDGNNIDNYINFNFIGLLFDNSDDVFDILVGLESRMYYHENNVLFIPIFCNNDNDTIEELNNIFRKTKVYIGITSNVIPSKLVSFIETNNGLLYYLGKSTMVSTSRNIFFMNVNMISIIYTIIGFMKENCDSTILMLDENYYSKEDMKKIIEEIEYHSVYIQSIYYNRIKKDVLVSFIEKIMNMLTENNACIISLLNKWTYNLINELDIRFNSFQRFKLLSFDLKLTKDLPKPLHFNNYLLQLESVYVNDYQDVFINPFLNLYQKNYFINDIVQQSFVSLIYYFEVLKEVDVENMDRFIDYHQEIYVVRIKEKNVDIQNNLLHTNLLLFVDDGYNEDTNQRKMNIQFSIMYMVMDQCPLRLDEQSIDEGRVIGFLFGLTGYYRYVNLQLLSAALINMIRISYMSYEIIDTKSTTEGCIEGLKKMINEGISYIVMGHGMYDCLIESVNVLDSNKDKDVSIWYVENTPGYFCDRRYVFFGTLPNHFLSSALLYLLSISSSNKAYIFYDSTNDKSRKYYLNIEYLFSKSPVAYETYSFSATCKEEMGDIINNQNGIVFITHPTNNKLLELVKYLHDIRAYLKNKIYLVEQTEDELIYFKENLLEGFYLVDSTFSIIEIDKNYLFQIPMSTLLKSNITAEMSNMVTATTFIIHGYQGSVKDTIEGLYVSGLYSYEGKKRLEDNNYLKREVKIVKILRNYRLKLVYEARGYEPDPFYYSSSISAEKCYFSGEIIVDKVNILLLIDSQFEKQFIDYVFLTYSKEHFADMFVISYRVYVVSTSDECRANIQDFINNIDISMLLIINIDVCSDELLREYNNYNRTIWLLSNYPSDLDQHNIFKGGLSIIHIIRPILLHLSIYKYTIPVAFITNPKWLKYYSFIEELLSEYNLKLAFKLYSTSESEIYESVKYLIEKYPDGVHLFIEQKTSVLESIIREVNLLSNNNANGLYDFLSFIESPNYFINEPFYIRIGTYLHPFPEGDYMYYTELQRIFNTEEGYPSIYIGLENLSGLYKILYNVYDLFDYTQYKSFIYSSIHELPEGMLYNDINNNMIRRLEISYYDSNKEYKEFILGYTNPMMNTYTASQPYLEIKDCTLYSCENREVMTIKVALVIPKGDINDGVYYTMISPFLFIQKYFQINNFFHNRSYMVYPFISEYSDNITLAEYVESLKVKVAVSLVVLNLDYFINIGDISKVKDIIIFNLGRGLDEYVIPIYTVGPSLVSISNEVFLSVMQNKRNDIYILYSKLVKISSRIIDNFDILFLGSGFTIHKIDYEKEGDNSTYNILINCYKSENCSLINTVPCSMTNSLYKRFMERAEKEKPLWDIYTLYQDVSTDYYFNCYLINSYYVAGYVSMIIHDDNVAIIKNETNNYYNFLIQHFDVTWNKNSEVSYAYDTIMIYLNSIERIDSFNPSSIQANMLFREFISPSGVISFTDKNQLSRNIYFGQIITSHNISIIHYNNLYASSPSLQFNYKKLNIYVGLLLDTKGGNEEELSRQIVLYSDTILSYINEKESPNNISYVIKRYSLYRDKDADLETMKRLLEDKEIIVLIGCTSQYCLNLYRKIYNPNYNKLFYPLSIPSEELCERYIILLRQNVVNKVKELLEDVNTTSASSYIFVYDNYSQSLIESIHMSKIPSSAYYIYPFRNMTMKEFVTVMTGKNIMNFITSDNLKAFEEEYLLYRKDNLKFASQMLFYFDEYQLGFDILKQLNGDYVMASFKYDSSSTNTNTFNKFLNSKLGLEFYISQTLLTYDGVFSVVVNSYNLAFIQMVKDKADGSSLVDYLQIASQQLAQSYLIGDLQGTKTNSFIDYNYLSEINVDGTITRSFLYGKELYPFEYNPKFKESCNVYRKEIGYKFSRVLYVSVIVVAVLLTILFLLFWIFLERYKSSSMFKYHEVTISRALLFSGYISIIPSLFLNYKFNDNIMCQISLGYIVISLYNFCFLMLNQIRWVGYCYGILKHKNKYTAVSVIRRTLCMDLFIVLFNVIFAVITPISSFTKNENKNTSNFIKMFYYPQCSVNTYYVIFNVIFLIFLFFYMFIYLYQLKIIKSALSISNYLTRSVSLCGFMVILFLMFKILLSDFTELTYVVEEMCIIIYSLGCNILILIPKLIYIHFHEMATSNTISTDTITTTMQQNYVIKKNNDIKGEAEADKNKENGVRKAVLSTIACSEDDATQNEY